MEPSAPITLTSHYGAMFVDFENVQLELAKKLKYSAKEVDVPGVVIRVLQRLKDEATKANRPPILIGRAYGTWQELEGVPNSLALMSIQPQYVLSHTRKNSADIELSLDVQEILLSREDIHEFLIVGGDRDYIPVVRRLRERGKSVRIAALEAAISGDLRAMVGSDRFQAIEPIALEVLGLSKFPEPSEHQTLLEPIDTAGGTPEGEAPSYYDGLDEAHAKTLDLILKAMTERGTYELPIVPFYKDYMNDAFVTLTDAQRKAIVNDLKERGLITLEVVPGPFGGVLSSGYYLRIGIDPSDARVSKRLERLRRTDLK